MGKAEPGGGRPGAAGAGRGGSGAAGPGPASRAAGRGRSRVAGTPALEVGLVAGLAVLVLVAHVATNLYTPYGVHRDELLYLAMGRHLRLWGMDFPPFIAIVAEAERGLLGDSLAALRLLPALAGTGTVLLAGLAARDLGGGRLAQGLAAFSAAALPIFLRAGNLLQPVVFDQLWWTLALWALIRIARKEADRRAAAGGGGSGAETADWLLLGLAGGLGLLTKFSIAFLGAGLLAGLLLSRLRRTLLGRGPWLAAGTALALGSPSLVGQIRLGWPVFGQLGDLRSFQLDRIGYGDFLLGQILLLGPMVVLAAMGLLELLRAGAAERRAERSASGLLEGGLDGSKAAFARAGILGPRGPAELRAVGWTCLAALAILMALHGKPYYAGPLHPVLLAAGGVWLERMAARLDVAGKFDPARAVRLAGPLVLSVWAVALLPLSLPLLPPRVMAAYGRLPGLEDARTSNRGRVLALPQDYADMLGWKAQAETVAAVYRSLPPEERAEAVIVGGNYGEAGAVDFFGPGLDLPPAVAPVGSYWFFGPGSKPGRVVIKIGGSREDLEPYFRSVEEAAGVNEPWVVPEERHLAIWVCRDPYGTLQEVWPAFRGQN